MLRVRPLTRFRADLKWRDCALLKMLAYTVSGKSNVPAQGWLQGWEQGGKYVHNTMHRHAHTYPEG